MGLIHSGHTATGDCEITCARGDQKFADVFDYLQDYEPPRVFYGYAGFGSFCGVLDDVFDLFFSQLSFHNYVFLVFRVQRYTLLNTKKPMLKKNNTKTRK